MTTFFAQLVGLFFVIAGFSIAFKRKMFLTILHEIFQIRALSYLFGVILLAFGLFLVIKHNIWTGSRSIVITILGWYTLVEALIYLFLSQEHLMKILAWVENKKIYYIVALAHIVLGGFLVHMGFVIQP